MSRTITALFTVALCFFCGACSALLPPKEVSQTFRGSQFVLVDEGKPIATIVIAESPTKNARAAAIELQTYIRRITGATLALKTDADAPAGPCILIGKSRLTDQIAGLSIPDGITKNLLEEGFVIRTEGNRLVLAGNDTPPYYGTRYAVAQLLHRIGVRWFMPGPIGEVLPSMTSLSVPAMNITQHPDFRLRNYWDHARDNMDADRREWKIHNLMNPEAESHFGVPGDSSVSGYLPKDQFKAHPEWFALLPDGTRSIGHPCMTSEGMINYFAERIKKDAAAGRKISAFAPDDGNPRCWCAECAKIGNGFDGYGANERDPVPELSATNEWFYFVNRILNEVNKEYPDFSIGTNGYANRDIPPEMPPNVPFNPNQNLSVMFANIGACTLHAYDDPHCWQMKRQGQMLQQWCKLSDKVWIYNYNYTMCVTKGTLTPMVHRIRRNIPLLKEWGCIGFMDQDEAEWALTGIQTKLIRARLEWDVHADVDAILDDFYTRWFGRAAAPMKAYYKALEDAFDKTAQHGHEDIILKAIYTPPLMASLDRSMRNAEAASLSESEKAHVQIERLMYDKIRSYVATEQAKRECKFAEAVKHLEHTFELRDKMNAYSSFFGWVPYPCYGIEWEKDRMKAMAAKTDGTTGRLVAVLPEKAQFRTDPTDDGRFERWGELSINTSEWKPMATTDGWDAQGLVQKDGRPYKGIAWYQYDMKLPNDIPAGKVFLCAPAVVNEAWLWVNGKYAGHRPYMMPWFRPQAMDLEVGPCLKPGQTNRITLRVLCNFEVFGANGIYERMFLYASNPTNEQAARP